jgi:hypothetical protein
MEAKEGGSKEGGQGAPSMAHTGCRRAQATLPAESVSANIYLHVGYTAKAVLDSEEYQSVLSLGGVPGNSQSQDQPAGIKRVEEAPPSGFQPLQDPAHARTSNRNEDLVLAPNSGPSVARGYV